MLPESQPKVRSAPDAPVYSLEELNLFERYTRANFNAKFGTQAPPWDQAKPIKRWYVTLDESVVDYTYKTFDYATGQLVSVTIPADEARSINLPGFYSYPKYVRRPTTATISFPGLPNAPLSVESLSTLEEAEAVARELEYSKPNEEYTIREQQVPPPLSISWNGETRRQHLIRVNGQWHNVAALYERMTQNGIGSPGHFDISGSSPIWMSSAQNTGELDTRPEVAMPMRDLNSDEEIVKVGPFANGYHIRKKAVVAPPTGIDIAHFDKRFDELTDLLRNLVTLILQKQ